MTLFVCLFVCLFGLLVCPSVVAFCSIIFVSLDFLYKMVYFEKDRKTNKYSVIYGGPVGSIKKTKYIRVNHNTFPT